MRVLLRSTCTLAVAALLLNQAVSVVAGPLEEGQAAAAAGDYTKAFELLRPLAEHGDVAAQDSLGVMYAKGRGVAQDHKEAAKWFKKAAKHGNAMAQRELGLIYLSGQGEDMDFGKADKWLDKAASQDDPEAQFLCGVMSYPDQWSYVSPLSPPSSTDPNDAVNYALLWRGLAKSLGRGMSVQNVQGKWSAQVDPAMALARAQEDQLKAAAWFRRAAALGHPMSQYYLGLASIHGWGTPRDHNEALKWLRLADAQGLAKAHSALDDVSRSLAAKEAIVPGATMESVLSSLSLTDVVMGSVTTSPAAELDSGTGTARLDGYEIVFDKGLVVSCSVDSASIGSMDVELNYSSPSFVAMFWKSMVTNATGVRAISCHVEPVVTKDGTPIQPSSPASPTAK